MRADHLRAFLEVLRTENFSAAALDLGVSQPAVSYAIRELEREFGVRLFERGRAGARPTEAGRTLAPHARAVLRARDAMKQQAALHQGLLQGDLTIAAYPSVTNQILPAVLTRLNETYPGLRLEVAVIDGNDENAGALHEHRVDAAFFLNAAPEEFIAWELFHDPYAVYVPTALFERSPGPVGVEALRSWPLILHRDNECTVMVDDYLRTMGVAVRPVVRLRDGASMLSMVAQGLGAAILAKLTRGYVPDGVHLLELEQPLDRAFLIAIQPESLKVPAVRAFLGVLGELYPDASVPPFKPEGTARAVVG